MPEGLIGHAPFNIRPAAGPSGPPTFLVLDGGEVCKRCNTGTLSRLDEHLQESFGFLKVIWNSTGTKKGKPASILRPGAFATRRGSGHHLVLNNEQHPITTPEGQVVQPSDGSPRAIRIRNLRVTGEQVEATFTQDSRFDKRFMRGLHKVAFELLCLQKGHHFVLDPTLDWVRDYVLRGRGTRVMGFPITARMQMPPRIAFTLEFVQSIPGWLATLTLGPTFFLDLTIDNRIVLSGTRESWQAEGLLRWTDRGNGREHQGDD